MTVSTAHNMTTHWKEHGTALAVTALLHIGALYWLTQIEMQPPAEPPKTQTIKLRMIQLPAPQTEPAQLPKVEPKPAVKPHATQEPPKPQPKPKQQSEKKILASKSEQKVSKKQTADIPSTETTQTQQKQVEQNLQKEKASTFSEQTQTAKSESVQKQTAEKTQKSTQQNTSVREEKFDVSNYKPANKTPPQYPEQALDRRLEGDCTITYTVNAQGRVENPKAQGDCHPLFVRPALQAAKQFQYQPRKVNGQAVAVQNVKNTFQFRIAGAS
uniref:energy transducer TonB n=1 Tax=uncultured Acinetobacter sp. TaxID=165433 RepID=UPI0026195A87|nr:energy transducer TonB [uncultured Acinetobacter sp.]